jgi:DNA helicase-2/ATP-dependent DNA helicase PcrA
MTRAMDQLVITRAVYRRRYGTDMPEASVRSRFLEEIPPEMVEVLGTTPRARGTYVSPPFENRKGWGSRQGSVSRGRTGMSESHGPHYSYEDEDQSASWLEPPQPSRTPAATTYNSIDNIAEFFASRGKKFQLPKLPVESAKGRRGFRPGQKVRHPKYGEGTVYQREGEGEEAKITVQFPRFGLKKLVEKYAQLEKA